MIGYIIRRLLYAIPIVLGVNLLSDALADALRGPNERIRSGFSSAS